MLAGGGSAGSSFLLRGVNLPSAAASDQLPGLAVVLGRRAFCKASVSSSCYMASSEVLFIGLN